MATRGRPRKVVVEQSEDEKSAKEIIAEIMHDYCSIPGCRTSIHFMEAVEVIGALKAQGYEIRSAN